MTDLVERLRTMGYMPCIEAADEIERLQALAAIVREQGFEIERLRAALEQAVDDFGEGHCVCEQTKQECIRALELKL